MDLTERGEQALVQLKSMLGPDFSLLLEKNAEARPTINADPFARGARGGTVLPLSRRRVPVVPERAVDHGQLVDSELSLINPWIHPRTPKRVQAKASVEGGLLPDEPDEDSDEDSIHVPEEAVPVGKESLFSRSTGAQRKTLSLSLIVFFSLIRQNHVSQRMTATWTTKARSEESSRTPMD